MSEFSQRMALYRRHPSRMVREMFEVEPDAWQEEALEAFARSPQLAMACSKGPGKTTTEAWCAWNFLLTREHPKGACCSNSGDNLRDNLWAEMAKWRHRNKFLTDHFEWTASRIYSKQHPETWFLSARSYAQTADRDRQADTLAGIHAEHTLFIIDEAGSVPDAVMVAAEAAMAVGTECKIVIGGNTTQLSGPLYRAVKTGDRKNWHVVQVNGDPDNAKRAKRISVSWARQMIEKYGRDNPWVRVNVFGEFPLASINALIGPEEVDAAMARYWRPHDIGLAAKVLGVDVARFGDDQSVIAPRQGIQAFTFDSHRNLTSTQGAGVVARKWDAWEADAAFIDNTGGFGSGWIDQLGTMGYAPLPVEFAGRAHEPGRYANKRAEMAFDAIQWIKQGGALPKDEWLKKALVETTYSFAKHGDGMQMILEPKDEIKSRLDGHSPDEFDAFILTFAEPVSPRAARRGRNGRAASAVPKDYDPFADMDTIREPAYASRSRSSPGPEFDPFR